MESNEFIFIALLKTIFYNKLCFYLLLSFYQFLYLMNNYLPYWFIL